MRERELIMDKSLKDEQETLNLQDIHIVARELIRHLGAGVRKNYTTVDGRILRLRKDVNGQGMAISWRQREAARTTATIGA